MQDKLFNFTGRMIVMPKYNEPQVYIINNSEIGKELEQEYNVASEKSIGIKKCLDSTDSYNIKYFSLKSSLIENLHEYKIIIIDLQNDDSYIYRNSESNEKYLFRVDFPKTDINTKPFVMSIISNQMNKESLRIIFADSPFEEEYHLVEQIYKGHFSSKETYAYNLFSGLKIYAEKKFGKNIIKEKNKLAEVIGKYATEYRCIFKDPYSYNDYIPILHNSDKEVISYISYNTSGGYDLILPVCKDKPKLIKELFNQFLPECIPDLFPESNNFAWLKEDTFKPYEIFSLEEKAEDLKKEYDVKLQEIDKEKMTILEKYKFLNDLITETGDVLVEAVKEYLLWLGFEKVELVDNKEKGARREDIQIVEDKNLFIIEVKGIGGTSTDSECAQIAKHRRRREKENSDKTIFPLYIVNHQRYKKPEMRENPPFSSDQIDYAINDERGLLTTWQLYQQYKLIERDIFKKEEIRECLKKFGLVDFIPSNLQFIGSVSEYYIKSNACILNLENKLINIGDYIWAYKDTWYKGKIKSMQVDSQPCQTVSDGEVGIVLDIPLGKGYRLYIKKG